jgi:formamidopyrimidine-DNA glycosylase
VPELPEVQALVEDLRARAVGHTVGAVWPSTINVLKTYDPPPDLLVGLDISGVQRHGKWIDLAVERPGGAQERPSDGQLHLCIHLARAGWLRWIAKPVPIRPGKGPIAFRVALDEGGFDLTEAGTQKKLAVHVVRDVMDVPAIASLGPDPLAPEFTVEVLAGILAGKRTQLKGLLKQQGVIAGVGNAYSDEVLWEARMSPFKIASSLTAEEVGILHAALVRTLTAAVERAGGLGAASLKAEKRAAMAVHARPGLPCPRCGDEVRSVSFADSSLEYCASCQTGGKPLADRRMSKLLR